jgi:SHS2 domain-containing protein
MSSDFRYLDHMTDVIIEAYGNTLDDAFENSARALVNTMFDLKEVSGNDEIKVEVWGHDLESLLYNWLEKVLLVVLIDNIVVSDFKVKISKKNDDYLLVGIASGENLNLNIHHYKVEVKAVTYHEMKIRQEKNKVTTRFLLDI